MRLFLLAASLAALHLASSGPHGSRPHDVAPEQPVNPATNASCQKCPSKTVTREETVITIVKTVDTETTYDKNCNCSSDLILHCKGCDDVNTTLGPAPTTPQATLEPLVITTTEAPAVPTEVTTPAPEPTETTTTEAPTVPTTVTTPAPEPTETTTTEAPTVPTTVTSTAPTTCTPCTDDGKKKECVCPPQCPPCPEDRREKECPCPPQCPPCPEGRREKECPCPPQCPPCPAGKTERQCLPCPEGKTEKKCTCPPRADAVTTRKPAVTTPQPTPAPQVTTAKEAATVTARITTPEPAPQTEATTQARKASTTVTTPKPAPHTTRQPTPAPQVTTAKEAATVTARITTPEPAPQTEATTQARKASTTVTTPKPAPQTTTAEPPKETSRPGPEPLVQDGECTVDNCRPPDCSCASTKPPGGLAVKDMPQFVMLTFDDAVTVQNMPFYRELLGGLKRKNKRGGCGVAATYFVSAEYTDYPSVNELYRGGNEIALHSISHKTAGASADGDYWNFLNETGWEEEVVDEMRLIEKFANVPAADIKGFRGPFLFSGGDEGFRMRHRHLKYDCTLVHQRNTPDDAPSFPFTLDFGFRGKCVVERCPNGSYPGHWSVPVNMLLRGKEMGGGSNYSVCSMLDACVPEPKTSDDTFQFLRANFENFYTTNRAPMPVFSHETWVKDEERKKGYLRFVDWLLEKDDVYLVTVSEVIDFMRNPVPKDKYVQRSCIKALPKSTCPETKSCHYPKTAHNGERYMNICGTSCPPKYPWVGNPYGD